jgi:hypothetical protein
MPKFGPSQRLEISQRYLNNNISRDRCNRFRLYDPIPPQDNVAEDGQVVMLYDTLQGTEVIPDAAGYQVEVDAESMSPKERNLLLQHELKKYKFGVNQGQKGVNQTNSITGRGWDISMIKGHDLTITHTGHEPISRNQLVAVRFPTEEDMQAQADAWKSKNSRGFNVSKFATYPVDENMTTMLSEKFYKELLWIKQKGERAYVTTDHLDAATESIQVPALLSIVKTVLNAQEKDAMSGALQEVGVATDSSTFQVQEVLSNETMIEFMAELAERCCDFVDSLRPPVIVARCTGFRSIHHHDQRVAKCGDLLKCQVY